MSRVTLHTFEVTMTFADKNGKLYTSTWVGQAKDSVDASCTAIRFFDAEGIPLGEGSIEIAQKPSK